MKIFPSIAIAFSLCLGSCSGTPDLAGTSDGDLIAFELNGYDASGDPAYDNAGGAIAAICTAVQANYKDAVSVVEDSVLVGQFRNEMEATGEDAGARAAVLGSLTPEQRVSLTRAAEALKGPSEAILNEMAKTAIQSAQLRDALAGFSAADAFKNAAAIGQIKGVLADIEVVSEMAARTGEWRKKAEEWLDETSALQQ